ncbi:hypothetical protein M413DRAFT_13553 [Hebeloma cylindrosporum]|uniref:Uncharacterized protein n=1 Tax=Hebeloma cylindrosporum TaxID=76867 RepID=A0A0C2XH85_HEBCY|nr:hypothetical protein M413DRAFT_13553 [Hebeloma cylindrosporum h7]
MVRVSTSVVAFALISVPVLAMSRENYVRDDTEGESFTREVHDALLVARKEMESVYGRELVDKLEARDPFFGALLGIVGRVAGRFGAKAVSKVAKPRKIANHVNNHQNDNNNRRHKRDILGESDSGYQFEREFDDLDVRGFFDDLD